MKKRTLEELAHIEKAIEKKFGKEAILNPASLWNSEKEIEYLSQLKSLIQSEEKEIPQDKGDYSLIKKLISKDKNVCPICDDYGLKKSDEVYLIKFECCERCYVLYVEGREEFWKERKEKILSNKVK